MTDAGSPDGPATSLRRRLASLALAGSIAIGVVVFVTVAAVSYLHEPGWGGAASGVATGLFGGLLTSAGGVWIAMRVARAPPAPAADPARGEVLAAALAASLDALERARSEVLAQVLARAVWRAPLGAAGGLLVWVLGALDGGEMDVIALVALILAGGFLGYIWAGHRLARAYDDRYRGEVLPALAAALGEFTYTSDPAFDLERLKSSRLVKDFDSSSIRHQLSGRRTGLPVTVTQVELTRGSGDSQTVRFDGLMVAVDLPRALSGVTAVVEDGGALGNFADSLRVANVERIRLEDPKFERVYEVYGTDQVDARALLNPAFMERLLALGERPGFGLPVLLADGGRLTLALPRTGAADLFRSPGLFRPAACRATLARLEEDLEAVIAAVDAVIALEDPRRTPR